MKNILSYIPGFRSNKTWKKIIASIYYLFTLIMLTAGIGYFLTFLSFPFLLFTFVGVIKHRNKQMAIALIVSIAVLCVGLSNTNTQQDHIAAVKVIAVKKIAVDKKIAVAKAIQAKKVADAKAIVDAKNAAIAKKIADAKAIIVAKNAATQAIINNKVQAAKAVVATKAAATALYQTWVTGQFDVWSNQPTDLVSLVKANLNNDKSFEYVSSSYVDYGTYLIIKMTYRASNSFGAIILQNVTAKSDYATDTITIISQNN